MSNDALPPIAHLPVDRHVALRRQLIAEGIRLLDEEGLSLGLERVTFERVVRLLDVHRDEAIAAMGTVGFPQDRFRRALIEEIFAHADGDWLNPIAAELVSAELMAEIETEGDILALAPEARLAAVERIVRAAANDAFAVLTESPRWAIYVALVGIITSQRLHDRDDLVDLMRLPAGYESPMTPIYRNLATWAGYRLREPYTWAVYSTLIEAIGEGGAHAEFRLEAPISVYLPTGRHGEQQPWSLLALGIRAINVMCLELDPEHPANAPFV
jgi:hypothetical protein